MDSNKMPVNTLIKIMEDNGLIERRKNARQGFKLMSMKPKRGYTASVEKKPPVVAIDNRSIYFSNAAIRYMKAPAFLKVYYDLEGKKMGLEALEEDADDAIGFVNGKKKSDYDNGIQIYIRWTKSDIIKAAHQMLGGKPDCKMLVPVKMNADADWYELDFSKAYKKVK